MKDRTAEHIERLSLFLDEQRTQEAIMENEDFLSLANILRCSGERLQKVATELSWISYVALPNPAILRWVSENYRNKKHN